MHSRKVMRAGTENKNIFLYSLRWRTKDGPISKYETKIEHFWCTFLLAVQPSFKPIKRVVIRSFNAKASSRDRYLDTGLVEILTNTNLVTCMNRCNEMGDGCRSFSANKDTCHLHSKKRSEVDAQMYVTKKGFTYYEEF